LNIFEWLEQVKLAPSVPGLSARESELLHRWRLKLEVADRLECSWRDAGRLLFGRWRAQCGASGEFPAPPT